MSIRKVKPVQVQGFSNARQDFYDFKLPNNKSEGIIKSIRYNSVQSVALLTQLPLVSVAVNHFTPTLQSRFFNNQINNQIVVWKSLAEKKSDITIITVTNRL